MKVVFLHHQAVFIEFFMKNGEVSPAESLLTVCLRKPVVRRLAEKIKEEGDGRSRKNGVGKTTFGCFCALA